MKKVLVFHSWGIGDLIMATPMLRTLAINGYKVDLFLTSETNSLVIKNAPFINKVFVGRSYLNIFLFFKKYDYLISTACIDPKK
jgi:ADP-heptose:LPS heptosyltransferase